MATINLSEVIGRGYASLWRNLHDPSVRYLAVKGGRGSKKSSTAALFLVLLLLQNDQTNALVVRRYERTLRDSCYAVLQWAIQNLKVDLDFKFYRAPLMIERISTGQKILFRGMDSAEKITSIAVTQGALTYCWIEEAFELKNETEFNKLDFSFRGSMPDRVTPKFLFTFNPWSEHSWLKRRFFDKPDPAVFTLTTSYLQNEWLSDSDRDLFAQLEQEQPRRYRIEGLGEWGISEGLIFERVKCDDFSEHDLMQDPDYQAIYGVDFGYTDPTAFVMGYLSVRHRRIYIAHELYKRGITNQDLAAALKQMGLKHEIVYCDAAEPKSIEELRRCGINAKAAAKGADSVLYGIKKLQNFEIIVSPDCPNFTHEITNYCWSKGADGRYTDRPEHEWSHFADSLRYAASAVKMTDRRIDPSNLAYLNLRSRLRL